MAKDVMAAKPMVLYESDDLIAMAVGRGGDPQHLPHEIDTFDPYEGRFGYGRARTRSMNPPRWGCTPSS